MWFLWGSVTAVCLAVIVSVFLGILSSAKVRKSPINQYVLFLMVPDLIFTTSCGVVCFMNASKGSFYSEGACYYESFTSTFGLGGSAWMNALIANEVYRMLSFGQNFRHYITPTPLKIVRDSLCTLALAAFVACWGVWNVPWLPHRTVLMNGIGCFPQAYDLPTSLFFCLCFFWALLGIPMGYVLYLGFQIWRHGLLPQQGRRRMLAMFFARLVAIYVIMWLPALLLLFVFGSYFGSAWVEWFGGSWAHLQGAVSATFIFTKPGVREAVRELFTCQCTPFTKRRGSAVDSDLLQPRSASMMSRLWQCGSSRLMRINPFFHPSNDGSGEQRLGGTRTAPGALRSTVLCDDIEGSHVLDIKDIDIDVDALEEGIADPDDNVIVVPVAGLAPIGEAKNESRGNSQPKSSEEKNSSPEFLRNDSPEEDDDNSERLDGFFSSPDFSSPGGDDDEG